MKAVLLACALVLTAASATHAQDPAIVDSKHYRVVIDNARTRVFRVEVPAGEGVQRHGHPDAIMVPLMNPPLAGTQGAAPSTIPAAVFVPAQTHGGSDEINQVAVDFVYVELKGNAPQAAVTTPAPGPGIRSTQLVAHQKADAFRTTIETGFSQPAGTAHNYDQVVVALRDSAFSLTVEGKTTNRWKRGDVAFIGRNVRHEAKNTGNTADFVIIAIK